jgi:hypothetical protein
MTFYEKSDCKKTPRYKQTLEYCKALDSASKKIKFISFGVSGQGRELPLMIIDKQGYNEPQEIRSAGRIVLMIQACIHPGESEGKDAGLMLLRDLVLENKFPGLLDHVSILFIPIFNVDGHERFGPYNRINQNGPEEMGWRVNATNLNLNRDYLKADTPEMQGWLMLFNKWLPEFFIDTHTTDGADYQYVLTYYMNIYGGMDENLTSWTKDIFLKNWISSMESSGIPVFPYIEFRSWHDPKSGINGGVSPPMLSQGYTALRNRPGLLVETHMLKTYRQRVSATYECLVNSLRILNKEYKNLQDIEQKADAFSSSAVFRQNEFPLRFKVLHNDSIMMDFLGIHYTRIKSQITGDNWYKYGTEKETTKIPFFDKTQVQISAKLPEAYIIPVEWKPVIERLILHGVRISYLKHDTLLNVATYRFSNPKWQSTPYEGRHPLTNFDLKETTVERIFNTGSALIDLSQPASGIIAQLLEPKGNGSFVYWGFFDAVFEQKEYAENYVMEEKAKKMLSENPKLKDEFEMKKQQDTIFAANPDVILNWFFSKTPYWDSRKDLYPVGKIMDRKTVNALLRK